MLGRRKKRKGNLGLWQSLSVLSLVANGWILRCGRNSCWYSHGLRWYLVVVGGVGWGSVGNSQRGSVGSIGHFGNGGSIGYLGNWGSIGHRGGNLGNSGSGNFHGQRLTVDNSVETIVGISGVFDWKLIEELLVEGYRLDGVG